MIKRYYIVGVVGAGKSTLREQLRVRLPFSSTYEEWPEEMAAEVTHAMGSMSRCSAEEIQEWIFGQLADKNRLILNDSSSLQIIDRSPLDTFVFYPPQEWGQRAKQMLEALRMKDSTPLASGELLFLEGSPREIHKRMDESRGYSVNKIAQQQSAFEVLIDWLEENCGYKILRINTRGLPPQEVVNKACAAISTVGYSPVDIQSRVEELASGYS
ncbi:MAG: AAA family ATPase [Coriobacteriia bacterium]|nr:AAA family ATPase [Coriobacteriia bacterium]MCL2870107.1 AAA family ATPase [Coriobacteriia bacterium]